MADLSPADQLHALLVPSTTEGQQTIEGNDTLKRLSAQYKDALEKQNVGQLTETIGSITRELNNAHLFEPNADRVIGTYNFAPYETRPETSREETAAPIAPGLKDFLPKGSGESGGGGGESAADKAKKVLYDSQKKATLNAFSALLEKYKDSDELPNKIDDFYRTHLSAAGVLGKQYEVLLTQARKLYGKNDEFDKHEDALKKEASENVEKLRAIHQIGPLQDPKDQKQRETELEHLNTFKDTFRMHRTDRNTLNAALAKNASDMFDTQWAQRGAVIDQFARELSGIKFSYDDIVRGVDSVVVTTFPQYPQEEVPPEEPVPQGPAGQGRGRGKAGQLAKGAVNRAEKLGGKELEKLGEAGAERAAQAAGTAAAEEAVGATVGELIFDFLISNPVGWAIDIILAIAGLSLLGLLLFGAILLITGGNISLGSKIHPTPPYYPTDYRAAIDKTFGIDIVGMSSDEYKWTWEKFWDISNTKFFTLLKKASIITVDVGNGTAYTYRQGGLLHIHLHHFGDKDGLDVILIHELSHGIDFFNSNSSSHRGQIPLDVIGDILLPSFLHGWLTYYSRDACLYHPPSFGIQLGEDYAETLAYYLNPDVGMLTACGHGNNPYANGQHPFHLHTAQEILGPY